MPKAVMTPGNNFNQGGGGGGGGGEVNLASSPGPLLLKLRGGLVDTARVLARMR